MLLVPSVTKTWHTRRAGSENHSGVCCSPFVCQCFLSGCHRTQITGRRDADRGSDLGRLFSQKAWGQPLLLDTHHFQWDQQGKLNSEEEFHEQMHCHGHSKGAVKFDIQLAKLPQLKVILQQLCTNSAGSGPGGEFELVDKCSASLCLPFMFGESYS